MRKDLWGRGGAEVGTRPEPKMIISQPHVNHVTGSNGELAGWKWADVV